LGATLIVAILAVPLIAAVRTNVWWLASYAVLPVFIASFPTESYTDPARVRLDRFRVALSRSTDSDRNSVGGPQGRRPHGQL
jgi:hypothetical protein